MLAPDAFRGLGETGDGQIPEASLRRQVNRSAMVASERKIGVGAFVTESRPRGAIGDARYSGVS